VNVNFFGDLNLNGNNIINVSKIIGMDGKWKIDSDGTLTAVRVITDELIAKNVKAETLCVGDTCITEEQLIKLLNAQGISSTGSESNNGTLESNSGTSEVSPPLGGETSTTTIEVSPLSGGETSTTTSMETATSTRP
jgi:hypothetical protein